MTTKRIAEEAGVVEPLIFRHFDGKAGLFREAVLSHLVQELKKFGTDHARGEQRERRSRRSSPVQRLYQVISQNRGVVMALVKITCHDSLVVRGSAASTGEALSAVDEAFAAYLRERLDLDAPVIRRRIAASSVMSAALLEGTIFGVQARDSAARATPADPRMANELELLMRYGVRRRGLPPPQGNPGQANDQLDYSNR